ncbi:hypothetical protein AMS68_007777 [Peltaster fructicola]|uniref:BOP1 N-terminal domain-containing protein n=1 Tax=Peltaster fructicola TaxID=286661 RepID=A0A6H0Y6N3_9PEZI|nr:hypothetical protein AMS68_007777 [Peltaster fructicola]
MAGQRAGQKRKVIEVPRPIQEEEESDASFGNSDLDDNDLSEDDSEDFGEEDEEELNSDEIPSSEDEPTSLRTRKPGSQQTPRKQLMGSETAVEIADLTPETTVRSLVPTDEDDVPNYTMGEDAHGNPRYLYDEIEPNYDSDDSAIETSNTIGNIPLSYYDAYPHIGYDINGKKINRPAKGEALDSLLDSIDIPEGWTGRIRCATTTHS